MQYQSAKLLEREEDLNRREQLQTIQEEQLESLKNKANAKLEAIEIQRVALTQAWEHVNHKEQQLRLGR